MRGISTKGIAIKGFTLSWIMVAGIIITLPAAAWALFFLPKYTADQPIASSEQTDEPAESQTAGDAAPGAETGSKTSGSKKTTGSTSSAGGSNGTSGGSTGTTSAVVLAALGDSITNAANPSSSMVGDNKSYSFSTGSNISSIYKHLLNSQSVSPHNLAVSGAKSADMLSGQIPAAVNLSPNYVTILIGGNDMLSLLSGQPVTVQQFQSNLNSAASQIKASGRRVLVGTIPNYGAIWQAGYPACASYPYPSDLVSAAIVQYNAAISNVASTNGLTLIDLYPYLGTGDVSDYDCLHPNLAGQQKIANRFIAGL